MRKFLLVVGVGTLVFALAVPAMALDFKFGSEYRVRFYSGVGVGFVDTAGSNPRGAQIRIRPLFDVKDDNGNIQGLLRLEIGDIEWGNGGGAVGVTNAGGAAGVSQGTARVGNGSGGGMGNDGVNVETKWAWIDAAFPFGVPLRVRAGLQPWFLPKGLIVDDDTSGVRLYGSVKPVSYDVAWYRVSGGPSTSVTALGAGGATATGTAAQTVTTNTADNNYDFYQFKIDVAIAPWLNPGIYYVYGRNAATGTTAGGGSSADSNYFGFTATGKVGIVGYDLDFVWGSAECGPAGTYPSAAACAAGTGLDVEGMAFDAGVHVALGPVMLNLVGSIATGDKRDGGDSEAFPTIAPSWNGPGGLFHLIGSGGAFDAVEYTQDAPTNLWTIGLTADYRPVKQLLTTAGVAYAGFHKKSGNCAGAAAGTCAGPAYPTEVGESGIGVEVFLRADWDVWTGFKVQGMMGWLFPPGGETAQEYILQLLYNF
jgi:hypothetical protein